ncbi:MAG: hypothetical protein P4L83_09990 [Nevskia sp.]|nr:hypothetical protein [Nevskia sp.]
MEGEKQGAPQNYNPRLISFITDSVRLKGVTASAYWDHVQQLLANPAQTWAHVFDYQLDESGRRLVLLVALNGGEIEESALRPAFRRYNDAAQIVPRAQCDQAYDRTIPIIVSAMLNRTFDAGNKAATYDLFSPSIGDFVLARVAADRHALTLVFTSLATSESVQNLGAMKEAEVINTSTYKAVLRAAATEHMHLSGSSEACDVVLKAGEELVDEGLLNEADLEALNATFKVIAQENIYSGRYAALRLVVKLLPHYVVQWDVISALMNQELDDSPDHESLRVLGSICDHSHDAVRAEWKGRIRRAAIEFWEDQLNDRLVENDVSADVYDEEAVDDVADSVHDYLSDQLAELKVEFNEADMQRILSVFDPYDHISSNIERSSREGGLDVDHYERTPSAPAAGMDPIDDLFERG